MGNLPLVFHFSIRFVVGLVGMWESHSDFQDLWKAGFAFHQAVISTGLPGGVRGFTIEDVAEIWEVVKRYGVVGLCVLTLLFVVLHPSPWCVGCES